MSLSSEIQNFFDVKKLQTAELCHKVILVIKSKKCSFLEPEWALSQ